jgi:hypothetical protein
MSGLDVQQLGVYVIRPTLAALAVAVPGIDGAVAEALLLATAAQESQFRDLRQLGVREGVGAYGLWQMERATEQDTLRRISGRAWLVLRKTMVPETTGGAIVGAVETGDQLIWNLAYACAIARMKYWLDPEPLPTIIDPGALWPTYKRVWNTAGGAATVGRFLSNYATLVAPHWPPPGEAHA